MKAKTVAVIGMMVWCVLTAVGLNMFSAGRAEAQGVDWTVTVRNPTPWQARITVWYPLLLTTWQTIEPGQSAVFHLGANCPTALEGFFATSGPFPHLQSTDMYGTWYSVASLGAVSCAHHKFKICSKPGKEGKLEDLAYSFCKE